MLHKERDWSCQLVLNQQISSFQYNGIICFLTLFANVKSLKQGLQLEASWMMIYLNGVITDNIRQFIHLHKLDPDVLPLCPLQTDERQLESSLPILPSESLGSHPFFKFIDSLQRQNETMKKTPLLSLGKLSYQCYITKMISDISLWLSDKHFLSENIIFKHFSVNKWYTFSLDTHLSIYVIYTLLNQIIWL